MTYVFGDICCTAQTMMIFLKGHSALQQRIDDSFSISNFLKLSERRNCIADRTMVKRVQENGGRIRQIYAKDGIGGWSS